MAPPLSKLEISRTLDALDALVARGYTPSLRELAGELGLSLAATQNRLRRLRDEGLVTWEPSRFRTLRSLRRGAKKR